MTLHASYNAFPCHLYFVKGNKEIGLRLRLQGFLLDFAVRRALFCSRRDSILRCGILNFGQSILDIRSARFLGFHGFVLLWSNEERNWLKWIAKIDKAFCNVLSRCFNEGQNCESPKISPMEYLKLSGHNLKSTAQNRIPTQNRTRKPCAVRGNTLQDKYVIPLLNQWPHFMLRSLWNLLHPAELTKF